MTDSIDVLHPGVRGRAWMIWGLVLPALGVAAFVVQYSLGRLWLPWYMPVASILGAGLVAASLWRLKTVWRGLALAAVLFLASIQILALYALKLPPYNGPVEVDRPFPAFETKRSDGSSFSQMDLIGDQNHALVFFRGRW